MPEAGRFDHESMSRTGLPFAVCHGRRPAVILELAGQPYDRIVVTVDDPDEIVRRLT